MRNNMQDTGPIKSIGAERSDLGVHVDLCIQRYERIEKQMSRLNTLHAMTLGVVTTAFLAQEIEFATLLRLIRATLLQASNLLAPVSSALANILPM